MVLGIQEVTLAIIVGTLAAIVYSLRILVLMERRIARIEMHVENVVGKIIREELKIEKKLAIIIYKQMWLVFYMIDDQLPVELGIIAGKFLITRWFTCSQEG